jgi:hypothetical protein
VDRARTPWVIAFSHKAWQMDSTTWSMFDILPEYKVDLHIVGHWHQVRPASSRGRGCCAARAHHSHTPRIPPHTHSLPPPWQQYTRYPPIDSRNNTVVIDTASMSADKSVYTNPSASSPLLVGRGCCAGVPAPALLLTRTHTYADICLSPPLPLPLCGRVPHAGRCWRAGRRRGEPRGV